MPVPPRPTSPANAPTGVARLADSLRRTVLRAPPRPRSRTPGGRPPAAAETRSTRSAPVSASNSAAASPDVSVRGADYDELVDYICSSPLLPATGLTRAAVAAAASEWAHLGALLAASLALPPFAEMTEAQRDRIYRYYLPVFGWVRAQVAAHKAAGQSGALVVGISAPQGCGKTTLVTELERLAGAVGLAAASVSLDDFYVTRAEQAALAEAAQGNRLLELRGNAGTHDLELAASTLDALAAATPASAPVPVPVYDKAAFGGLGDRAPRDAWRAVAGPLDVVLLEGWMLGFAPVGAAAAAAVDADLPAVDAALAAYRGALDARVGAWLVVDAPSPACVYAWRLQAEVAMRASGRGGMTDEQVADFCDRYMPAYEAYLPGLRARGPTTVRPGKLLTVAVADDRSLAPAQPAPAA